MEFKNILYENRDGILYLTLNRPEVRNALSPEMWQDIRDAVAQARRDDSIRVLIISGTGDKALASGADIQELHDRYYMDQMIGTATTALRELEELYKPVICAINGYALGGGCELAEACDLRVATRRSKFGQPEINLGIIPGAGGTQRLVRLVGLGKAKELIYTGRIISAEEAQSIGLVNIVTEDSREALMAEAEKLAKEKAFALGCPSMGAEQLEESEMEPFVEKLESMVSGKRILLFGSYGWGDGEWMREWAQRMKEAGAVLVREEGVIANEAPDEEALAECRLAGKELV